ncbi:MAG TPA: PadR family transcriptional regulator [Anaerolineae bacterium]|nr:PadR family transcriptional regulator [Anaerolineae bacterium]
MSRKAADELLTQWEEAYKKGLLTFWILLLLHEQPRYAFELSTAIAQASNETINADDQSVYRALKRFEGMRIVSSYWEESPQGPPRKYYRLTEIGEELLRKFIQRNILLFQDEAIERRVRAVLNGARSSED